MLYSTNPLIFVMARKPNLEEEKNSIYSKKFFHNFDLSENSLLVQGFRLVGKLKDRNELDR